MERLQTNYFIIYIYLLCTAFIVQDLYILQSDHHHKPSYHHTVDPLYLFCPHTPNPSPLVTTNRFYVSVSVFFFCFVFIDFSWEWNYHTNLETGKKKTNLHFACLASFILPSPHLGIRLFWILRQGFCLFCFF